MPIKIVYISPIYPLCTTTTTPMKPSRGLTNVVKQSHPTTPTPSKGRTKNAPRPDGRDLKSTWAHCAWLATGCTTVLVSMVKCIIASYNSNIWVEPLLAIMVGYVLADLVSGVFHWIIDNYGNATTPILGPHIKAFQGHHKRPWTITKRQFANKLYALARVITFTVLPTNLLLNDPTLLAFLGSFSGCIMFSQQFHAWSHTTKSKLPKVVVALQDFGVLVSRKQHAAHHCPPYNSNYCIVSGIWNKFLDENKVFDALELMLFFKLGMRPRSWSEPGLEWVEDSPHLD